MTAKNLRTFLWFFTIISSLVCHAQTDVTQFLGIPVDGTKPAMLQKLKAKGFTTTPSNKDVLVGEFNGTEVNLFVKTNNNKVCRIMVADANTMSEGDIKIRFNRLCQQFEKNPRYVRASDLDYTISDDEDISYELAIKNKRYEAIYYQKPIEQDSAAISKEIQSILLSKYTKEQLANPTEELKKEFIETGVSYMLDRYTKKTVWFMISELYGKYYISMYYDNEYNRANGEEF